MKLLYLSCHSVLEYDEVKLFKELGIDVFSHGVYANPNTPSDIKRPPIEGPFDHHLVYLSYRYGKEKLPREFIEPFDVVMVQHVPDWVVLNWETMKDKVVVWRTIGQSTIDVERLLEQARREGMKIVRYSPTERTIPGYIGEDAIIRFYKDPDEFGPYTGEKKQIFNITQSLAQRVDFCNFEVFKQVVEGFPWKVAGSENEALGDHWIGCVDYQTLREELRKSRVYFYTGTYPASYTLNFIEAWMTGIPVVAIGPRLGNSPYELGQRTYEVPDLIKNGVDGFFSDDVQGLRLRIGSLMEGTEWAKQVGEAGRKRAIEIFGKETIKRQWKEFFEKLSR
jgi:hypothetical protein